MKAGIQIAYILFAIGGSFFVAVNSANVHLELFLDLSKSFLESGALIFAIIGGWLALFFPEDFKGLFSDTNSGKSEALHVNSVLNSLLISLILSGFVVLMNLSIVSLAPFVNSLLIILNRNFVAILVGESLFVSFLGLSYALASSIAPAVVIYVTGKYNSIKMARNARTRS